MARRRKVRNSKRHACTSAPELELLTEDAQAVGLLHINWLQRETTLRGLYGDGDDRELTPAEVYQELRRAEADQSEETVLAVVVWEREQQRVQVEMYDLEEYAEHVYGPKREGT